MPTTLEKRFGRRVAELRTNRNWTQEDLSERTGISREHISRIENGHKEIGLNAIGKIAKTFTISISELMESL